MRRVVLAVVLAALVAASGPQLSAQWRPGGQMRIVFLVDSSNAISAMLTDFRAGLLNFLEGLPGDPEVMLISTGGQLRVRVGPTTDRTQLKTVMNGFFLDGGGNSFLDTLLEADRRFLKSVPDRRPVFIILTTDTDTVVSDVRIADYNRFANDFVARGGRAHGVVVQGDRTGMTTRIVEHLVKNTGGYYDAVAIAKAVPRVMRTLVEYAAADQ
jgi:hypothetical protein